MRRASETAAPIAAAHGLEVEIVDGLVEYDATVRPLHPDGGAARRRTIRTLARDGRRAVGGVRRRAARRRSAPGSRRRSTRSSTRTPGSGSSRSATAASSTSRSRSCSASTGSSGSSRGYTSLSRVVASRDRRPSVASAQRARASRRDDGSRMSDDRSTVASSTTGRSRSSTIDRPRGAQRGRPADRRAARRRVPRVRRRRRRSRSRSSPAPDGTFCAGADLKAVGDGRGNRGRPKTATDRWARRGCCSTSR